MCNKVYMVLPPIFPATIFSLYFENNLLFRLEMWQYQFSQTEEATSKTLVLGHYPFNLY